MSSDTPNPGKSTGSTSLSSFVTDRPIAVLMVFLSAVVFGYLSYGRLSVTLMPELSYPTLTVRTEYSGAAPEEVENDVSRPIEEALGIISGLRRISSISRAGVSDVVLEFAWNSDMSDATQDVLEKLDLVFLPDEADRPLILHFDPSLDPVMELTLSGTGQLYDGEEGLRRLRRLAELQVKRRLEPIEGVAAVRIRGGLEEEIQVLLEEERLRQTGLSIRQVIQRLGEENINVAGGTIQEGRTEYLVRTVNEFEGLDQIEETIVASPGGRDVRVGDLGRVVRSHKEREILTRTDGGESVQIEIYKEGDANIVGLAHRVKDVIGAFDPAVDSKKDGAATDDNGRGGGAVRRVSGLAEEIWSNEGALLKTSVDRSLFVESSIDEVRNTAIIGGLLAIIVLFLFLRNVVSTVIIGVSIPISVLITFAPLNLSGVTLNIMSLGGLALGIGMLVDSSIVVLESIYRCREEGDDVSTAAVRGTSEVRAAVLASTLTTIAVFLPMVFVEGIAGQAFNDLGLAVVFSLVASLIVALFFIPMLASRTGANLQSYGEVKGRLARYVMWENFRSSVRGSRGWRRIVGMPYWIVRLVLGSVVELVGKILLLLLLALAAALIQGWRFLLAPALKVLTWLPVRIVGWVLAVMHDRYPAALRWALAHRLMVLFLVPVLLWATWIIASGLNSELLPEVHQGEFTVEAALPVGTPLEETDAILTPVERAILEERESIRSLILTVGYDPTNTQRSDEGEHTARFRVLLDSSGNPALEDAVIERLRGRFSGIPDLDVHIARPVLFSSKTPIEVEILGDDLAMLKQYSSRAAAIMETLPELADVEMTLQAGAPEVQIVYDRERLSRFGLNIRDVAGRVRDKVMGFEATRFNLKDRRIPILVRLATNDRETVEDIGRLIVNPGGERPITLATVADVSLGEGPSEVRRIDSHRTAVIRANLAEGSLSAAVIRIEDALNRGIDWPTDMSFLMAGQNEEWESSRRSLVLALVLSLFLVYVIMAAQFESLLHPLVIMVTVPLAGVGTVVALKLLGMSFSVVVFLGMIMLAGIVVNNAIVLVDYINRLRRRGMERDEAIVTAGSVRLRPILMTTATTVLGLLPMALGLGDGAEIRTPMAIAVIGGLISSTALTLLIVPTIYSLVDGIASRFVSSEVRNRDGETGDARVGVEDGMDTVPS